MHSRLQRALIVCAAIAGAAPAGAAPGRGAGIAFAPASYIGIGVMDVSDRTAREIGLIETHGIEISSVAADSPAGKSGLRAGDIILTYRGERVHGYQHFARLVRETPVGRTVELGLVRDGQRQLLAVRIGERDMPGYVDETRSTAAERLALIAGRGGLSHADAKAGSSGRQARLAAGIDLPPILMNARNRRLGTDLEGLGGQLAAFFGVDRGVLVRHVRPGSIAALAGLRAGDVIVSVAGEAVGRPSEVGRLAAASEDRLLTVGIVRDRSRKALRLDVGSASAPYPAKSVSRPD